MTNSIVSEQKTERAATLSDEDRAKLDAWCAEVRRRYAKLNQPITDLGDPRWETILRSFPGKSIGSMVEAFSTDDLGRLYAQKAIEFPEWPLPVPDWVESIEFLSGSWPEVEIDFSGKNWHVGAQEIRVRRLDTIYVDTYPAIHDFPGEDAGTYYSDPAQISVTGEYLTELTADEAILVGVAFEDAGQELARSEQSRTLRRRADAVDKLADLDG